MAHKLDIPTFDMPLARTMIGGSFGKEINKSLYVVVNWVDNKPVTFFQVMKDNRSFFETPDFLVAINVYNAIQEKKE